MYSCQECGSLVIRRRRVGSEKLLFKACFKCRKCGADTRKYHAIFQFRQEHVDCPLCGTVDLGRLSRVDKIDRMTRNPFRHLLRLLGARLYHCSYCRYQFYDFRPLLRAKAPQQNASFVSVSQALGPRVPREVS